MLDAGNSLSDFRVKIITGNLVKTGYFALLGYGVRAQLYFTRSFRKIIFRLKHLLAMLEPHCRGPLIISQKNTHIRC